MIVVAAVGPYHNKLVAHSGVTVAVEECKSVPASLFAPAATAPQHHRRRIHSYWYDTSCYRCHYYQIYYYCLYCRPPEIDIVAVVWSNGYFSNDAMVDGASSMFAPTAAANYDPRQESFVAVALVAYIAS